MATHDETTAGFAESDLISLGEKLASLDLTDPERAALGALLTDDDVAGFGRFDVVPGIRLGIRAFGKRAGGNGVRADNLMGSWEDELDPNIKKPGRF